MFVNFENGLKPINFQHPLVNNGFPVYVVDKQIKLIFKKLYKNMNMWGC